MSVRSLLSEHTPREHNTLPWVMCSCSPGDWFDNIFEWSEHLAEMALEHAKDLKRCPRCGSYIPTDEHAGEYPGALSRWDNRTEICSECGVREGMIEAEGELITPVDQPLPDA